jgi:hypothetical protein
MLQLLWADFRVRIEIVELLKAKAGSSCSSCSKAVSFQVAFCYHVGFGMPKDDEQVESWLQRSGRSLDDIRSEFDLLEGNEILFHPGIFLDLWNGGSISPIDLAQHYREHQLLSEVDKNTEEKLPTWARVVGLNTSSQLR